MPDPLVRYLSEPEVRRIAPTPAEWVQLGARALAALASGGVQLPPKSTIRPRDDAFANAMPAYVPDGDLLGMKWVSAYRANPAQGLPVVHAMIMLAAGESGVPRALLAATWLTAARTAGVSGACLQALAPDRDGHLAITGAGVQARTHLQVADALGIDEVAVWARRAEAGEALVRWAAEHVPGVLVRLAASAEEAADGAIAVVTAVSMGVDGVRLHPSSVPEDALLLPLDYATSVGADLTEGALLTSDDVGQFERFREDGAFPGYRAADMTTGEAIGGQRVPGRIVCQNLGTGVADLVFADAIVRAAKGADAGVLLPLE